MWMGSYIQYEKGLSKVVYILFIDIIHHTILYLIKTGTPCLLELIKIKTEIL